MKNTLKNIDYKTFFEQKHGLLRKIHVVQIEIRLKGDSRYL
jgi:hypothetical protein